MRSGSLDTGAMRVALQYVVMLAATTIAAAAGTTATKPHCTYLSGATFTKMTVQQRNRPAAADWQLTHS